MLTCEAESLTKPKIHDYETPSDMFSVHEIPNSQQCVKIESLEIMKRGGGFGCGREAQRGLAMLTNHILELSSFIGTLFAISQHSPLSNPYRTRIIRSSSSPENHHDSKSDS